ncbi:MAG: hypothetical protein D6737_18445 [Chloroflexi bacterium]|nr:MAG: hypothetical protein D6737_18445 [Chloroflexota bacterium]
MRKIIGIALLLTLSVTGIVMAQDDDETAFTASGWLWTDLDDDASDEGAETFVVFLSPDDGATLIEVARGADVVYTLSDDGLYSGATLVPAAVDFAATLEVIDEDTRQVMSVTRTGALTFETNLQYDRSDVAFGVWVEGERDLMEYTMFAECLGREDGSPPSAFATPDPILPIAIDDEAGTLTIGGDLVLSGGGGVYERVDEAPFGQFTQVITQTATVSDDSIAFTYHAIADGRDDCEVRYETTFVPFDADYEALLERGDMLGDDA